MRLIMPTLLFVGITNITGIQMLVPMGKEIVVLRSEIGGAVTDIILNALLIPKMASAGAAIGTLAAEMVVLIIQYTALRNEVAPAFKAIQYLKISTGIIVASAASFWVLKLSLGSFVTLLISAVIFFAVYGGFLLVTGEPLTREIIATLYNDLRSRFRKR
jgi:O-antigen/teichoic acid export membrane protein